MALSGLENLSGVLAFVRAAEARSFTAAARALGISPSGVSKAISRLEAGFGVRLLHRTSRSVTMTPEGTAFYERCRQIVADLEDAEQALSAAHAAPRGRLRITMPLSVGRLYLAGLLPKFLEQHPDVIVEASASDRMVDMIDEGFDVAIRLGEPPDSRLVARQVVSGALVTCASPRYLKRHGTPRRPSDLLSHNCARFVVPSTGVPRDWLFREQGRNYSVPVQGNLSFDHAECLVEAACAGTAMIQISSYVTGEALRKGLLRRVLTRFEVASPAMWVMYPQNRHLTPRVRAFVDFLLAAAREGRFLQ